MPLTLEVTQGYTMVAGATPSVADWNALGTPSITIDPGAGLSGDDIADDGINFDKLNSQIILGGTALTTLQTTDMFLVGDNSEQANAAITVANALNGFFSLATAATAFTDVATDLITFYNGTGARSMVVKRFVEQLIDQISTASPLNATPASGDKFLLLDADATDGSQAKGVTYAEILPDTGTPGTYANPTSITTDSKGRVTAVTGTAAQYTSDETAIPSAPTYYVGFEHGLVTVPSRVEVVLVVDDAGGNAGHADNAEVEHTSFVYDAEDDRDHNVFYVSRTTTHVYVTLDKQFLDNEGTYKAETADPTTGVRDGNSVTLSKWKIKVRAWK